MQVKKKKCKVCKDPFPVFNSLAIVCSPKCAAKYASDKTATELDREYQKIKKRVTKENIPKQLKLTQKAFNKMRVMEEKLWFKERGIKPYCISCGKTDMDWCCGHYKTVGSSGRLRFDRKNTYLQCNRYCNMALSGNIAGNKTTRGYKEGLVERFDPKGAAIIEEYLINNQHAKKWIGDELIEMRKEFNQEIRYLKEELNCIQGA